MIARTFILLFLVATTFTSAGEYRFQYLVGVTGLGDLVYDEKGKETTVKLDFADRESAAIFLALQKKRIYGTKELEEHRGVKCEQGIILFGEFTSETKRTLGGPGRAVSEPYRNFSVTGIKVKFPIYRFQEVLVDDVDPPVFLEIHFSFDTLFPKGLRLKGKPIDLKKHPIDHTDRKR